MTGDGVRNNLFFVKYVNPYGKLLVSILLITSVVIAITIALQGVFHWSDFITELFSKRPWIPGVLVLILIFSAFAITLNISIFSLYVEVTDEHILWHHLARFRIYIRKESNCGLESLTLFGPFLIARRSDRFFSIIPRRLKDSNSNIFLPFSMENGKLVVKRLEGQG